MEIQSQCTAQVPTIFSVSFLVSSIRENVLNGTLPMRAGLESERT